MRIAFFSETFLPQVDGIVFILQHLFDYLEEHGHESVLFAPRGTLDSYAATPVIHQSSVKMPMYEGRRVATPLARVEKKVLAFKPDLIHLVAPTSLGVAGLRVARKYNIPLVASFQTDLAGFARHWKLGALSGTINRLYRRIHNAADLNLVPSEFTRKQLAKLDFKRLKVWPGGVDLHRFTPKKRDAKWRKRLSKGHPDDVLILFVSRLSREKRADLLLPIVKNLNGVRLAIVGDGPDRKRLEKIFKGTHTYFAGYLWGEDLATAFASGDLFIFTGAEETFGNVVVEAMAAGLPVIAPNSGGVVDLVAQGKTGFLYSQMDGKRLLQATKKLVEDPGLRRRMGKAGRERAKDFSWENTFDLLMDEYTKLLRKKGTRKTK